jgi:hypothetical protein
MVVTPRFFVEKKARTVQVRAFFCVSCTRQPAPLPVVMVMVIMVVIMLMRFMDVVYSVIFICLCPVPILVKVSAGLSQRIFTFHPFHCSGSMRHNDLTIHLNLRHTALDTGRYNHT